MPSEITVFVPISALINDIIEGMVDDMNKGIKKCLGKKITEEVFTTWRGKLNKIPPLSTGKIRDPPSRSTLEIRKSL